MVELIGVAAVAANGVIGNDGELPWPSIPANRRQYRDRRPPCHSGADHFRVDARRPVRGRPDRVESDQPGYNSDAYVAEWDATEWEGIDAEEYDRFTLEIRGLEGEFIRK